MKIITRKKFEELKKECTNYEKTKSIMTKCINEIYPINNYMFNELLSILHSFSE